MDEKIFVILVNGEPHLDRDSRAIRMYKTRERAEKSARSLTRFGFRSIQVGEFATIDLTEVSPK